MIYKEILEIIANGSIAVMKPYVEFVRHMLTGNTLIKPLFIYAAKPFGHCICPFVAFYEMHEICLNEEHLLLGELRLNKRHAALGKITFGNKARFFRNFVKGCSLIRIEYIRNSAVTLVFCIYILNIEFLLNVLSCNI